MSKYLNLAYNFTTSRTIISTLYFGPRVWMPNKLISNSHLPMPKPFNPLSSTLYQTPCLWRTFKPWWIVRLLILVQTLIRLPLASVLIMSLQSRRCLEISKIIKPCGLLWIRWTALKSLLLEKRKNEEMPPGESEVLLNPHPPPYPLHLSIVTWTIPSRATRLVLETKPSFTTAVSTPENGSHLQLPRILVINWLLTLKPRISAPSSPFTSFLSLM